MCRKYVTVAVSDVIKTPRDRISQKQRNIYECASNKQVNTAQNKAFPSFSVNE